MVKLTASPSRIIILSMKNGRLLRKILIFAAFVFSDCLSSAGLKPTFAMHEVEAGPEAAPSMDCCNAEERFFVDDLLDEDFVYRGAKITIALLHDASFVSFSSDRFVLQATEHGFCLSPTQWEGPFSSTDLKILVDDELKSWRLYTFINGFDEETYSRADISDAVSNNNVFLYKRNRIDKETYEYNMGRIFRQDLSISYGKYSKTDYTPWSFSQAAASQCGSERGTERHYNGYVHLQDCGGLYHELGFFRFYLIGENESTNQYEVIDYCDLALNGSFSLVCPSIGYRNLYFRIYAAFDSCHFLNTSNDICFVDLAYVSYIPSSFFNYTFDIPLTWLINPILWAISIGRASNLYAKYLNGGGFTESVPFKFTSESSGTRYSNSAIYFYNGDVNLAPGHLNALQNWDLVSHEYGHYVHTVLAFQHSYTPEEMALARLYQYCLNTNHNSSESDCDKQFEWLRDYYVLTNSSPIPDSGPLSIGDALMFARGNGLFLAWRESWPTYFGNCMQNYFYSYLHDYPTCCNNQYDFTLQVGYPYETVFGAKTDSCEKSIISFLYNLNDSNNDAHDTLSVSDQVLFSIFKTNNSFTFNQFYQALLSYGINSDSLGNLLEHYEMCPAKDDLSLSVTGGLAEFEFDFEDNHLYYDYDSCDFEFFAYEQGAYSQVASIHSNDNTVSIGANTLASLAIDDRLYLRIKVIYPSDDIDDYYFSRYITINTATMEVI